MKLFKRKKKEVKPVVYDAHGFPLRRPTSLKKKRKVHKIQRPSMFTEAETKEILGKNK